MIYWEFLFFLRKIFYFKYEKKIACAINFVFI
nr:MAG TPA: hypothetical protein [Caudoviricetes sp.]